MKKDKHHEYRNDEVKASLLSFDQLEHIQDYIGDLEDEIDILNNLNDKEIMVDLNEFRNKFKTTRYGSLSIVE